MLDKKQTNKNQAVKKEKGKYGSVIFDVSWTSKEKIVDVQAVWSV